MTFEKPLRENACTATDKKKYESWSLSPVTLEIEVSPRSLFNGYFDVACYSMSRHTSLLP